MTAPSWRQLRSSRFPVRPPRSKQRGRCSLVPAGTSAASRTETAVYFAAEMLKTRGETLEGKTCLVSGSGNVAQYTIEKLLDLGARPVTLSDSGGYIYDEAGIDRDKLAYWSSTLLSLTQYSQAEINAAQQEFTQYLLTLIAAKRQHPVACLIQFLQGLVMQLALHIRDFRDHAVDDLGERRRLHQRVLGPPVQRLRGVLARERAAVQLEVELADPHGRVRLWLHPPSAQPMARARRSRRAIASADGVARARPDVP